MPPLESLGSPRRLFSPARYKEIQTTSNYPLCALCIETLQKSVKVRKVSTVSSTSELLEDTLGKDCCLCHLNLSKISAVMKAHMHEHKLYETSSLMNPRDHPVDPFKGHL
jgi:hypothetical protein